MFKLLKTFERGIVLALLSMLMVAVGLATVELGVVLIRQVLKPPLFLLDIKEMLEVFGFFLMVLLGLELLETVKAYLEENSLHVEVVLLVAMVAMARKVVILDYKTIEAPIMYGIAAMVLALSLGYYLVMKGMRERRQPPPAGISSDS